MANVATYTEIEQHWDICLVYEANMVLSYQQKVERYQMEKARSQS